jgi:hypothetical protein
VPVFVFSILVAYAFLLLERMFGIEWDFHSDAVAYITNNGQYGENLAGLANNLYFFIANWLGGSLTLMIGLNIIAYALTNVVGCLRIRQYAYACGLTPIRALVVTLVFLIQPYRLHLSVHVLKDTLIIFLLLLAVTSSPGRAWSAVLGLLALRLAAVIYFIVSLPRKLVIALLAIALLITVSHSQEVLDFLIFRNEQDMGGRDFDTVPNFVDYGPVGALLRGLMWPLLLISGAFWLLSPALMYLPIALEVMIGRFALSRIARVGTDWLPVFLVLALLAILVNSFTAYVRYAYPLVCVLPVIGLRFMMTKDKSK